jgi:ABC-type Fe3+/spermidine/putrescine transport system ATPase subunit
VAVPAPPPGLAVGDAVRLVVRPEAIALTGADLPPGSLPATVEARTFLGEKTEYVVRCAGEALQVVRHDTSAGGGAAVGARVGVSFATGAVSMLPGRAP